MRVELDRRPITGWPAAFERRGPVRKGIEVPFNAKAVYGFDVAVDEGEKEISQQVWRGTARNAEDTSGFGSIVLTDTPAQ